MSPVQNRLAPGEEPFAIFVAAGEAGVGDLFAVRADGGTTSIAYTRVREMAPALSPAGTDIAFIREGVRDDPSSRRVVVMNLLNGAERVIPAADAPPEAVAWSDDATRLLSAWDLPRWLPPLRRRTPRPGRSTAWRRCTLIRRSRCWWDTGLRECQRLPGWRGLRRATRRGAHALLGRREGLSDGEVIRWATSWGRRSSFVRLGLAGCANSG